MCGINGIFAYAADAPKPAMAELIRTRDAMRSRGPDGAGEWASPDGSCLLGHRRLAIIDLSERGHQPMRDPSSQVHVVFNGEIYNYPELRAELEAGGVAFHSDSDTEILLHLYRREGVKMLPRLRGMFAIALWDPAKRAVLFARDPFGIKPLFLADDGKTVRFASQIRALRASGAVSSKIDPAGLVSFYLFGSVAEPFTLFRDITLLNAGHYCWADARGVSPQTPFFNASAVLGSTGTGGSLQSTLAKSLRDSVEAHLLADVEVGIFLSSGLDSATLLALMREVHPQPATAITLAFDHLARVEENEADGAAQIAEFYGARHVIHHIDHPQFMDCMPDFLGDMDQPSIDGVNTWFVSRAAAHSGLKVALSGLGADEVLGGYPSFADVPGLHRRYGALGSVPGVAALAQSVLGMVPGVRANKPKAPALLRYAKSIPAAYFLRRALYLPHELKDFLPAEQIAEGLARLAPVERLTALTRPDPGSDMARVSALELGAYMRNQLLRDTDWASMAHSLEVRVPFVDPKFLGDMAPHLHSITGRAGKEALARAANPPLPDWIVKRPKTGFSVPIEHWVRALGLGGANASGSLTRGHAYRAWSRHLIEHALA